MSQPPRHDDPMLSVGLAAHLRNAAPVGDCPDAETLAVYGDGESPTDERARIEAHLVSCLRCQAHLASLVRSEPPTAAPGPSLKMPWRWLVPIASVALIVLAVWVNRAPPSPAEDNRAAEQVAQAPPLEGTAPESRRQVSPDAGVPPKDKAAQVEKEIPRLSAAPPRREADRLASAAAADAPAKEANTAAKQEEAVKPSASVKPSTSMERSQPAPPPAAAATPQSTASAAELRDRASLSEPAPAASAWRLVNGAVERTTDGGATWTNRFQPPDVTLRAISGPSPTVCWAVGDAGAVFRTTDGVNWTRVIFPEELALLVSVDAQDADRALVITESRRRFTTENGGVEWRAGPPR